MLLHNLTTDCLNHKNKTQFNDTAEAIPCMTSFFYFNVFYNKTYIVLTFCIDKGCRDSGPDRQVCTVILSELSMPFCFFGVPKPKARPASSFIIIVSPPNFPHHVCDDPV